MGEAVRRTTAEVERRKLEQTLREVAGNKARAAETLQITYKSLLQKMKEYRIAEQQ